MNEPTQKEAFKAASCLPPSARSLSSPVDWQNHLVAVGTTIADRPPHRSVRARLRIRLLPWMSGGEACIRIGVQNTGLWNPPVEDWEETIPSHLCALTATD